MFAFIRKSHSLISGGWYFSEKESSLGTKIEGSLPDILDELSKNGWEVVSASHHEDGGYLLRKRG